jgi:hypothetical protein
MTNNQIPSIPNNPPAGGSIINHQCHKHFLKLVIGNLLLFGDWSIGV